MGTLAGRSFRCVYLCSFGDHIEIQEPSYDNGYCPVDCACAWFLGAVGLLGCHPDNYLSG